jgi:hypothetical protein
MKYFHANPVAFYSSDIHDTIPEGAVEITDEKWLELLDGQSKGQVIAADETGQPILQEPAPPPPQKALSPREKLEKLGLTPEDLRELLAESRAKIN